MQLTLMLGTLCSGTDVVADVALAVSNAAPFPVHLRHAFTCEKDPLLRRLHTVLKPEQWCRMM
jgi:hypothetical protein